ncbi:leucyl aminopeptidase family protein [Tessaracoccus palaemonis]|uniref:Probable cytosol aminopeptidase n=1 Tax=Tessaracoccus palaemonis TaxID=2829499 RepID=A0ABX8SKB1_9ACTN|nr:leucyl aminopeptidase [Tessaracoccus palaemonis]QXT62865.1 leucyl aminopeptidase [Tessaracoccus palaemonis]
MTRSPNKLIPADFAVLPGLDALEAISLTAGSPAADAEAVGYTVFADGDVPAALGLDRGALTRAGFDAAVGKTLIIPTGDGPELVAVGAGAAADLDSAKLRDLAAAFVRAASRVGTLGLVVGAVPVAGVSAAAAIAEGAALARYRYTVLKSDPKHVPLASLTVAIDGASADDVTSGLKAGLLGARAGVVARDVTNTPPGHLTAVDLADISEALGERFGFDVETFDKAALIELGCGGLLGVNQGSVEEPRMIKLTYSPDGAAGHLGLVGKGIMYDSGGISLKPSDPMHLLMKMDMGGAAAVLGAFTVLQGLGVAAKVTGWLMCTDNMPSGTAYKLGDVLVARDGTTVEVKNTDAEGRLAMMDGIALANEDGVDAIIDIATLTGAALMALGQATAPVFANDDRMAALVEGAAEATGESVWRLPLERKYRPQLDSDIADISNLGGKYAGATTAALFLDHFVRDTPWAHLDIAGTMQTERDDSWRTAGATGFGARLIAAAAADFRPLG